MKALLLNVSHTPFHRRLTVLMLTFAIASLIHFIHNAEFVSDYPGLPKNWTTNGVYGAWVAMTLFGTFALVLSRTKHQAIGLALVIIYAICGLDSLGHYWVAPFSAHTTMMNVSILIEVFCAFVLALFAAFEFCKLTLARRR